MNVSYAIRVCQNCGFCAKSRRSYAELECRRNPPIMVEHKSSCATWVAPGWPDVKPDDWCGEWVANRYGAQ